MQRLLPLFAALVVVSMPSLGWSQSEDSTDEAGVPQESGEAEEPKVSSAATPPSLAVDALGRPYPDPRLLRRSRVWSGIGIAMTATSGALVVSGMTLGSAFARGELLLPAEARYAVLTIFSLGVPLALAGIPLASAGVYMNRQLRRTIRGQEKVPRVVGNESRYWNYYLRAQYGQAMTIAGGAGVLLGTLSIVAVAGLVGTDQYDPRFWLGPVTSLSMAAGMIAGGIKLRKSGLAAMEAVRDEVDPMRQPGGRLGRRPAPEPGRPAPLVSVSRSREGEPTLHLGVSWSMSF